MQLHGDTPVARNESAALLLVAGKGGIRADFCLFWTMPTMKVKYAYRIGGAAMRAIFFTVILAMLSGAHAGEVDADELMQWQAAKIRIGSPGKSKKGSRKSYPIPHDSI